MSEFPSEYPGVVDGVDPNDPDPDAPSVALTARIELMMRSGLWDSPEFKDALVHDFGDISVAPLPDLDLRQSVDLMLQAFWAEGDESAAMRQRLEARDWLGAAELMRRESLAPDEILIASRVEVAACVKRVVERLLAKTRGSAR